MKPRTIKRIINDRIFDWIDSIEDERVQHLVQDNVIVSGGCIPSMLLNEEVNDFDVYLRSKEAVIGLANYYVQEMFKTPPKHMDPSITDISVVDEGDRVFIRIASSGVAGNPGVDEPQEALRTATDGFSNVMAVEDPGDPEPPEEQVTAALGSAAAAHTSVLTSVEEKLDADTRKEIRAKRKAKYKPKFMSGNAITLTGGIQLVVRFFGEPEELHKNFDFAHCMGWWDSKTGDLELPNKMLQACLSRELIYNGSRYPLASILRVRKFYRRGWTCHAGHILKMVFQLQELNLKNFEVLKDQLMGVDFAYFAGLISAMEERHRKNPELAEQEITAGYVAKLVDEMMA